MTLELRGISKYFAALKANDNISLKVPSGIIQGILGENGAGKSTLMKILSGFIRPDAGTILFDDSIVTVDSPACAARAGLGMLHQDPLDFPPFNIIDNFLVGSTGGIMPNRKKAREDFLALAARFDFSLSPEAPMSSLTVGERQQVEILRVLWRGAKVLILDEPTTGISLTQKEKLFAALKKMASDGMTVFFVSHKLEDVAVLCARVIVLRQGKLAGAMDAPFDNNALIQMMFGKAIPAAAMTKARSRATEKNKVLHIEAACIDGIRVKIQGVDLDLCAGEVIGLAGMEGSGQELFLGACGGLVQASGGQFFLSSAPKLDSAPKSEGGTHKGGPASMNGKTYHDFKKRGVRYLPAARLEKGLIPGLNLAEHYILTTKARGAFINTAAAAKQAAARISAYNIKGRPDSMIESLSGGNQQRALVSLLPESASLILVEHPTRGLDIESTIYIWGKLKERCAEGTAILFISSDLDEVLQYSDRVLVFFAGRVSPPLDASTLSVQKLGALIGGIGWEQVHA